MQAKQAATVVVISLALPVALAAPAEAAPYLQRSNSAPSKLALKSVPRTYLSWYQQAAHTCHGLPWPVLAGIGEMESDHGQSTAPGVRSAANFAGAEGPMQFEPRTFAAFAVRADRSHRLSPYNPQDAIFTAAHMLCANGARGGSPSGITSALYAYNHADWYPPQVMSWAAKYATRGRAHRLVTKRVVLVRVGHRRSAVVHTITSRHPHRIVAAPYVKAAPHIKAAPHTVKPPHVPEAPHVTKAPHVVKATPTVEAPHQTAPHQTAPHQTAPHQTAPHQTAPHQTAPHKGTPQPARTVNPLAPTTGPATSQPKSPVPAPSATQPSAISPESAAPTAQPTAPEPATSETPAPQSSGDAQQLAAEAQRLSDEARQLSDEAEQLSAEAQQLSAQLGPTQPGPAQPGPTQPGPTQPGPTQPGPAQATTVPGTSGSAQTLPSADSVDATGPASESSETEEPDQDSTAP
jgi:hypothetical protein